MSSRDPEQGCGLMIVALGVFWLVVILALAYGVFR